MNEARPSEDYLRSDELMRAKYGILPQVPAELPPPATPIKRQLSETGDLTRKVIPVRVSPMVNRAYIPSFTLNTKPQFPVRKMVDVEVPDPLPNEEPKIMPHLPPQQKMSDDRQQHQDYSWDSWEKPILMRSSYYAKPPQPMRHNFPQHEQPIYRDPYTQQQTVPEGVLLPQDVENIRYANDIRSRKYSENIGQPRYGSLQRTRPQSNQRSMGYTTMQGPYNTMFLPPYHQEPYPAVYGSLPRARTGMYNPDPWDDGMLEPQQRVVHLPPQQQLPGRPNGTMSASRYGESQPSGYYTPQNPWMDTMRVEKSPWIPQQNLQGDAMSEQMAFPKPYTQQQQQPMPYYDYESDGLYDNQYHKYKSPKKNSYCSHQKHKRRSRSSGAHHCYHCSRRQESDYDHHRNGTQGNHPEQSNYQPKYPVPQQQQQQPEQNYTVQYDLTNIPLRRPSESNQQMMQPRVLTQQYAGQYDPPKSPNVQMRCSSANNGWPMQRTSGHGNDDNFNRISIAQNVETPTYRSQMEPRQISRVVQQPVQRPVHVSIPYTSSAQLQYANPSEQKQTPMQTSPFGFESNKEPEVRYTSEMVRKLNRMNVNKISSDDRATLAYIESREKFNAKNPAEPPRTIQLGQDRHRGSNVRNIIQKFNTGNANSAPRQGSPSSIEISEKDDSTDNSYVRVSAENGYN